MDAAPTSAAPSNDEIQPRHMSFSVSPVEIDCLLPNGFLVVVKEKPTAAVRKIKEAAFVEGKKLPLGHLLPDADVCSVSYIHESNGLSDLIHENFRFCDLHYLQPVLRFEEVVGSREEKKMRQDLYNILGFPMQGPNDFLSPALQAFRSAIFRYSLDVLKKNLADRDSDAELRYQMSPEYFPNPDVVQNARCEMSSEQSPSKPTYYHKKGIENLEFGCLGHYVVIIRADELNQSVHIVIRIDAEPESLLYHLMTALSSHPRQVVELAIRHNCEKKQMKSEKIDRIVDQYAPEYVLRLCSHNEYLIDECPLWQYRIVTELILAGLPLTLELVTRCRLLKSVKPTILEIADYAPAPIEPIVVPLWKQNFYLRFKVNSLTCVTFNLNASLRFLIAGQIFCFQNPVSSMCFTRAVEPTSLRWNDTLEFDLHSSDIPRGAVLAIAICSLTSKHAAQLPSRSQAGQTQHVAKNLGPFSSIRPLSYACYPLFDYNNCLLQGQVSVFTKPVKKEDLTSRSGGPSYFMNLFNAKAQQSRLDWNPVGPCIHLDFEVHRRRYSYPVYSDFANLLNTEIYRQQLTKEDKEKSRLVINNKNELRAKMAAMKAEKLSDDDRDVIWANRENLCRHFPDSLPLLLSSMRWSNRLHVACLYHLLRQWKPTSLELVMTLMTTYIFDLEIQFSLVQLLSQSFKLDSLLSMHLLQVVQLLRLQAYPDNPLIRFLLKRAFSNQRFANFFFWICVSEKHTAQENDPFRNVLLLVCELIFRASSGLRAIITRQHDVILYLRNLASEVKMQREEEQISYFESRISAQDTFEALSGFISPLHPSIRLGKLLPRSCRILKSAKLPIWLAWEIDDRFADPDAPKYELIFKQGDDLRQDLLILQLLWLMDDCWLRAGIDSRIRPYQTMPVGKETGFIEVVTRAKTVMNIQRQYILGAIQFNSGSLLNWLVEKNLDNTQDYRLALANFTQSCAAYCVATFILGVGDRHPDNIMVCENGRLVHIDFGHFLNHRKKKLGINRERVPFVLTDHFIHVISEGRGTKSTDFLRFQEACAQLYLLIRGASQRLQSIFLITLHAQLPELKTLEDADYIKKTLCLNTEDDRKAAQYFQNAFSEAHGGQWSTKLDWFFHWVKHWRA